MTYNSLWNTIRNQGYSGSLTLESVAGDEALINAVTGEAVGEVEDEIAAAVEESAELSSQVDEIQSAVTTAEIGETVADVGQQIEARDEPATLEEAALLQAGVAQTLNASGADEGEIADAAGGVAQESNGRYTFAMEGFVDYIKKMWQGIQDFVGRVIQGIKNTWNRLWNSTASVLKKAEKLKKLLEKKKDKLKSDSAEIDKWHGFMKLLSLTSSKKFEPKEIVKKYKTDYGKEVTKKMADDVTKKIKTLKEYAEGFGKVEKDAKIDADAQKLVNELASTSIVNNGNTQKTTESRIVGKDRHGTVTEFAFGNFGIANSAIKSDDASPTTIINSFTVKSYSVNDTFSPRPKDFKFKAADVSFSDLKEIPTLVEECVKGLEDWYNKGSKKADDDIQDLKKKISEAVNKVNESDNSERKDGVKVAQRLFVVPTQLLRGSMELCVHVIRTSNALVSFGNLLAKEYEDKDSKD